MSGFYDGSLDPRELVDGSYVAVPTGFNRCPVCGVMYAVPGAHMCDPRVVKPRSQSVPGRLTFTVLERD